MNGGTFKITQFKKKKYILYEWKDTQQCLEVEYPSVWCKLCMFVRASEVFLGKNAEWIRAPLSLCLELCPNHLQKLWSGMQLVSSGSSFGFGNLGTSMGEGNSEEGPLGREWALGLLLIGEGWGRTCRCLWIAKMNPSWVRGTVMAVGTVLP